MSSRFGQPRRLRWRWRWLVGIVTVPTVALTAGMVWLLVSQSLRLTNPPGYTHPGPGGQLTATGPGVREDPQSTFGLPFQEVLFPTAGFANLRGWLVAGADDAHVGVVTAHGRGSDRRDFLRHLPVFHGLGLPTLLFDFREHGISDGAGRGMSMGYREAEDISAAVRYLKEERGLRHVIVVGVSLGASSAILAAAQDPAIDAVVAESPFASMDGYLVDEATTAMAHRPVLRQLPRPGWWPRLIVDFTAWRLRLKDIRPPSDVIDQLGPRPIVLMHGTGDEAIPWKHSQELYARAQEPKVLWIADGAEHTQVYDDFPDEYQARISALTESFAPKPSVVGLERAERGDQ